MIDLYIHSCYREKQTLLSWIIKRTVGKYTHTAAGFYGSSGSYEVWESQKDGFNIKSVERWQEDYNYIYVTHVIPNVDLYTLEGVLLDLANTKYGKFDLLRHWIYKKSGIWFGIDKEHKKTVCSESVMLILERLGVYEGKDAYKMNPTDVFEYMESKYDRIDNDYLSKI